MRSGGHQIPWNAIATRDTSKTSWQMGNFYMKEDFGEPFKGPIIPFGALVEYLPISARDQGRIHQFGKKVLPGFFLGYAVIAVRIWILIADIEELENVDASEIYSRRLAKEVLIPQRNGEFVFPVADGSAKLLGRHYEVHEPTPRREQIVRSEGLSGDSLGAAEESQPTEQQDETAVLKDFWSLQGDFVYRHHIEPRVQLCVPTETTFTIPLKYIDVTRSTCTDLDIAQEKRNDDCWDVAGNKKLSDSRTGFTKFTPLKETPPRGYTWSGGRD